MGGGVMVRQKNALELDQMRMDRSSIENLFAANLISTKARAESLKLIYPHENWGLWAQRLFLILGFSLILSSIVFFFAFNWATLPKFIKLGSIECGLLIGILCSFIFDLKKIIGQIALFSVSIFIGVFMAVFGQIYQSGADAYQLFMIWSAFVLPLALISTNSFHWLLWYVVTALAIYFYCNQVFLVDLIFDNIVWVILAFFTSGLLVIKAYFMWFKKLWLPAPWTSSFLVFLTLCYLLVPSLTYIFEIGRTQIGFYVQLGFGFSIIVHALFYLYFRFKRPSIVPLSFTYLSLCIMIECVAGRLVLRSEAELGGIGYLLLLIFTLGLFSFATMRLHSFYKQMRIKNAA
jgi:uncharacterized membrane protein